MPCGYGDTTDAAYFAAEKATGPALPVLSAYFLLASTLTRPCDGLISRTFLFFAAG